MGRRKRIHIGDPTLAFSLLVAIGIIWVVVEILQQFGRELIGVAFLIVLAAIAYWVMSYARRQNTRRALLQKSQMIVDQQIGTLTRRRAQLVWPDAYGMNQLKKWEEEKDRFIAQLIHPALIPRERSALQREYATVANLIETSVLSFERSTPAFNRFFDNMSPSEFECFCAEELRRAGWDARVTKQSRDQGVDVIAEKGGIRVAIQCKLYTRPVGNKAVQEAAAARAHEQAHYGIVVSNNRYTQDAEQLASTNRIWLLHYSDLQNLQHLLGAGFSP